MTLKTPPALSPAYSVVIPVYNSESSLVELCDRIRTTFEAVKTDYEIILVDDCSADNSWKVLKGLAATQGPRIKIIQLMRNFGQHNALMCGFHYACGKYIITMDDDLQNPPEEIPKLIDEINKGYDCVFGAPDIKRHAIHKNMGSLFIRYLNEKIFGKPKELILSSFRIMTRSIVDEITKLRTPYPYISGMLLSLTKNVSNATVRHESRRYGASNYNLRKLVVLAFNLVINYTALPLRVLAFIGITISLCSFFMGLFFVFRKLMTDSIVPGWTSVVVLLSFFNGLLLAALSIIGEYLARIIGEVSNRQQFTVREKHL